MIKKHPMYYEFKLLPSGRRYETKRTRTNRHGKTFIPPGIKALNMSISKLKKEGKMISDWY